MKLISQFVLFFFAALTLAFAEAQSIGLKNQSKSTEIFEDVQTVPFVNLEKYLGRWYEVASIPQTFQKKCVKNTQANYEVDENSGYIVVNNTCTETDGYIKTAEGRARIENEESQAELKVTFVKLINWVFTFGGDYWVIGLQRDYQWAVVGHPSREYAWILSRDPNMSKRSLRAAHTILVKNGYDTCTLLVSIQDGGRQISQPLCELFAE
jgi:apolipoprotein D and lipocalin family protein